jgi:hypothetical protein
MARLDICFLVVLCERNEIGSIKMQRILNVAEKPSVAKEISKILARGGYQNVNICPVR